MNKFKNIWIKKSHLESDIEEECKGAQHYKDLANKAPNKMEEQAFNGMAMDEERHAQQLRDMETNETTKHTTNITQEISKPGPSIHSEKWDRCVTEVGKDPNVNAYAVCTAQLGEESFKSQMTKSELSLAKAELEKAIDITQAGGIPNSLLARQDLKGDKETTTKSEKSVYIFSSRTELKNGSILTNNDIHIVSSSKDEARNEVKASLNRDYKHYDVKKIEVFDKGQVDETGKQLDEEIKQADNSSDFVENIKAIQLKRQKAILEERSNETFKSNWKKKYERK